MDKLKFFIIFFVIAIFIFLPIIIDYQNCIHLSLILNQLGVDKSTIYLAYYPFVGSVIAVLGTYIVTTINTEKQIIELRKQNEIADEEIRQLKYQSQTMRRYKAYDQLMSLEITHNLLRNVGNLSCAKQDDINGVDRFIYYDKLNSVYSINALTLNNKFDDKIQNLFMIYLRVAKKYVSQSLQDSIDKLVDNNYNLYIHHTKPSLILSCEFRSKCGIDYCLILDYKLYRFIFDKYVKDGEIKEKYFHYHDHEMDLEKEFKRKLALFEIEVKKNIADLNEMDEEKVLNYKESILKYYTYNNVFNEKCDDIESADLKQFISYIFEVDQVLSDIIYNIEKSSSIQKWRCIFIVDYCGNICCDNEKNNYQSIMFFETELVELINNVIDELLE